MCIPKRMTTYAQYIASNQQERNALIMHIYSKIMHIASSNNYKINLLHNKEVIDWLFGNIEYLEKQITDDIKTKSSCRERV